MDGVSAPFGPLACQRWSLVRLWCLARLLAHCLRHRHHAEAFWGDCHDLMARRRPNSWAVTYICWECEWKITTGSPPPSGAKSPSFFKNLVSRILAPPCNLRSFLSALRALWPARLSKPRSSGDGMRRDLRKIRNR